MTAIISTPPCTRGSPLGDGIDDKPAYTGPGEDCLRYNRTPEHGAKLDSHYRDYRQQSIAQGVFPATALFFVPLAWAVRI